MLFIFVFIFFFSSLIFTTWFTTEKKSWARKKKKIQTNGKTKKRTEKNFVHLTCTVVSVRFLNGIAEKAQQDLQLP